MQTGVERGTIPCTGAGLASFYEWTLSFPGPVTGTVPIGVFPLNE
ncbi:hypothetical protein TBK1r_63770 [Stieleria magnilauensis]|uniref:Uncharacterized protein n=1 Tax=Stieleria magnilauensis TaxID=2527963 RepID=A0ABX5Y0M8_9BACT|nr:hypothetical protein TBK1r_63770 [Planctomycetes bacterium TBK1r]